MVDPRTRYGLALPVSGAPPTLGLARVLGGIGRMGIVKICKEIQGDHIIGRHTILLCSSVFVEITNVMMVNNGQSIHRRNLMIKIKPSFPEILMN